MQESIEPLRTELEGRLRFETLLAQISAGFINLPASQVDSKIEDAQRHMCELLDLDRSALWQVSKNKIGTLVLTHIHPPLGIPRSEWPDAGDDFPWMLQNALSGKIVIVSKMSDLPPEAAHDRESLERWNTKATVVVPLSVGGKTVGALSFACLREERDWPETIVTAFQLLAQVFANALERNHTEQALRDSEARLSLATNAAGAGLWIMETDTRKVWVSARTRELFHFAPDEDLSYESFFKAIQPEDCERVHQAVQWALQSGESLLVEFRIVLPCGSIRWISARGGTYFKSSGDSGRLMGVSVDITERKVAVKALEERLRFEQLLSDLSAGFVNIPPDQVDSEIERGLQQILEVFHADRCVLLRTFPGRTLWQITHLASSDDIPPVPVGTELPVSINPWAYDKLIRKREVLSISRLDDLPPEANVDRQTWTEWGIRSNLNIPIIIGEPVDHIIAINSIKSERVWPEEYIPRLRLLGEILVNALERRRAQIEIAASELRYRTVADYTYDWEYWSAPDGTLNYVSPSCERITGYSVREFMDDPLLFLKIIDPEDREIWVKHNHGARDALKPREIQFRIRTKGGEIHWIDHACLPVSDAQGRFLGIRASNRDTTDRKKAEFEAQQHRNELAHVTRVAALGELTSSIAHELNQPLAAIRNYANAARRFLSQGEPDLSKAREALEGIIRDDRRAAEVMSRIRGLLKKEEPRYRSVDINNVIQESLALIRTDSIIKGLSIETELAPAALVVLGDRVQLQQVLLNLILNAADAMNKAKPDLSKLVIKTENERDQGVKVSVKDFGGGIDETHRDKLFEPFYTTKPGGMGMGLAISARIIHAHGGSIWAENNPDGGAIFYFTIPAFNN